MTDPGRKDHWYNPVVPAEEPEAPQRSARRGSARERMRRRREDKALPAVNWTWAIIAVGIIGVIGVITLIAWAGSRAQPVQSTNSVSATATLRPFVVNATEVKSVLNIRPWDGKQRFTVLIMGIDKRPGEVGTGFNTDTLILLSINPATKSIGMLSIPRDIVVPLPGQETMQHINTAYAIGELQQPGGGPKMAMQTVQYNFGMPVNSYVVLSFDAVINFVDDIGGIDLDVPTAINDPEFPDMNNGFDPLYIPAGRIHMDGKLALKYARTRHQDTDFERARRQQQVILAVRQKALTPEVISQLAGQAPTIWNHVTKGVLTNIAFDQAVGLGLYVKDIPTNNIQRGTVEDKYVQALQYNGANVVTPNRTVIGQLMAQVFGPDYNK